MTTVCVPADMVRRQLSPGMFSDMASEAATFGGEDSRVLEVTIPAVLTAEQERSARLRLTTVDDVEASALLAAAAAVLAVRSESPQSVGSLAVAVDLLAALVLPEYLL